MVFIIGKVFYLNWSSRESVKILENLEHNILIINLLDHPLVGPFVCGNKAKIISKWICFTYFGCFWDVFEWKTYQKWPIFISVFWTFLGRFLNVLKTTLQQILWTRRYEIVEQRIWIGFIVKTRFSDTPTYTWNSHICNG